MNAETRVYLFGSLRESVGDLPDGSIKLDLKVPIPLIDVLNHLEISPMKVQMAMINHRAVSLEAFVYPGYRISLFPREYAVFADWKSFRL